MCQLSTYLNSHLNFLGISGIPQKEATTEQLKLNYTVVYNFLKSEMPLKRKNGTSFLKSGKGRKLDV